jgi:hypothetical protein
MAYPGLEFPPAESPGLAARGAYQAIAGNMAAITACEPAFGARSAGLRYLRGGHVR